MEATSLSLDLMEMDLTLRAVCQEEAIKTAPFLLEISDLKQTKDLSKIYSEARELNL